MDYNKIPVTIYITPEYYTDRGHFWSRLNLAKRFHSGHQDQILLLVSYKYYKPEITEVQLSHYMEANHFFPNMAIVHAKGVKWNGFDKELVAMGIPIYECEYPGK